LKLAESGKKTKAASSPDSKSPAAVTPNESAKDTSSLKEDSKVKKIPLIKVIVFLILFLFASSAGWLGWQQWQVQARQSDQIALVMVELNEQLKQSTALDSAVALSRRNQQEQAELFTKKINDLQLQITAQGARIAELGSTSRSDWYLSEATYLARLASQRLQTERSTKNPIALLLQVDAILVKLDESDLLAVRSAIAEDISRLRLAGEVDVEGIILELNSLARQIEQLELIEFATTEAPVSEKSEDTAVVETEEETLSQRFSNLIGEFSQGLSKLIKVRQRDRPIEPILLASEEVIVRNNLRLFLRQAANAVLREEQDIYTISLGGAREWLTTHFQMNPSSILLQDRLAHLEKKKIVQELPNINSSIRALEAFLVVRESRMIGVLENDPVLESEPTRP